MRGGITNSSHAMASGDAIIPAWHRDIAPVIHSFKKRVVKGRAESEDFASCQTRLKLIQICIVQRGIRECLEFQGIIINLLRRFLSKLSNIVRPKAFVTKAFFGY